MQLEDLTPSMGIEIIEGGTGGISIGDCATPSITGLSKNGYSSKLSQPSGLLQSLQQLHVLQNPFLLLLCNLVLQVLLLGMIEEGCCSHTKYESNNSNRVKMKTSFL